MVGRTISHYRIVSQLGAGGMGVVYGADDTRLGRPVALKFVPDELARDHRAVERFRVEARTASALNHSNICTIYDIDEYEGRPFIVMEWMKGQTLRDRIFRGLLKVPQVVDVGIQVADALAVAHAEGIVHRDIKPANIFLTDRGQVKVMDFGLAKLMPGTSSSQTTLTTEPLEALTLPGSTLGTVAYMSPEQAVGDEVDFRTDLFSLGVVLYECATGHRPFPGDNPLTIFSSILNRAPVAPSVFNPDLPMRLQEVINNCLEKDRDLRYQNAADLRADLKRVKRDLESGRIAVAPTAEPRTGTVAAGALGSGGSTVDLDHTPSPSVAPPPSAASAPASSRGGHLRLIAAVVAAVAVGAVVASYALWPRASTPTDAGAVAAPSAAFVRSRAELAARSLQAKEYRAAHSQAGEVLAAVPDHQEARAIRDEAGVMLGRFDSAIERARALITAGDPRAGARALTEARAIDPVGPGVADVSALLAGHIEKQAEAARQELDRARPGTRPQPAGRAQASSPQVQPETPREAPPVSPVSPPVSPPASPPSPPPAPARDETPPKVEAPEPAAPPAKPPPVPVPADRTDREPAPSEATSAAADEAAIRRLVATYGRALETRDLALFRSVYPNLSRAAEQRIQRAVPLQQVTITILSIVPRGQQASVRLRRRDIIQAGGRQQVPEIEQTLTLARTDGGGWVIVSIGE